MKLTAPLLALTLAVSASAQTPAAKPATASTTRTAAAKTGTVAKPATAGVHATPNGPSNIPVVHGIKKPLYTLTYIDTLIGIGPLAVSSTLGKSQADSKIMWYTVHYTGWLAKDGTKFDSSYDHKPDGSPLTFPYGVGKVIPGWDTGFEGMHVGGKRRIFVPYQLAYGPNGRPPTIPGKSDLIFDVELIAVSDKPPTQPAPPAAQKSPTTPAAPGAPKAPAAPGTSTTAPAAPAAAPATAAPAKPATN